MYNLLKLVPVSDSANVSNTIPFPCRCEPNRYSQGGSMTISTHERPATDPFRSFNHITFGESDHTTKLKNDAEFSRNI